MYIRAQAFIREHLRDPELCIDQISAALGCTKRYLHMLFSDRGMTVSDYIWHARLQNCRHELETHAGKTVTDVAFSWGFSSSSHFSRVFRKYFGIVPSSIHKAQHGSLSLGRLESGCSPLHQTKAPAPKPGTPIPAGMASALRQDRSARSQ